MAFRVADVNTKYKDLRTKHADFKITLRDSNINPSEQFFVVVDRDGNWIQFVGVKK